MGEGVVNKIVLELEEILNEYGWIAVKTTIKCKDEKIRQRVLNYVKHKIPIYYYRVDYVVQKEQTLLHIYKTEGDVYIDDVHEHISKAIEEAIEKIRNMNKKTIEIIF